jgi:glycosyltransferase involved in cell wall biosynthesis
LKIGFFYPPYYPLGTGASVHGYYLVKGLKKRGHQILSCLGDENPDCINFERTKTGAIKMARQADVLYIRINTFSFLKKATLLKLVRPFSLPVVWEVNAPTEELHANFPPGEKRDKIVRTENLRRKSLARFVSAGIGVSETLKAYIKDFLGIKKAYLIPNGSDPDLFSPDKTVSTPLIHLENKFKIIWTGNANPWQGIELIVETAKKLEKTHPDIIFIIITNDSKWTFPVLKNLLVLRGVPYTDIPSYITDADVCLCLYKEHNWHKYGFYNSPLKLFDYMASKKPVIASDMGQISTVIRDGINGLLTDNSIDSIINKIIDLKTNMQKREVLGKSALEDVIKYYNWDRVAEQTEAALLAVCDH